MSRSAVRRAGVPVLDVDLYDDATLTDPADAYRRIRDAGPVVWLPRHRLYAIGRHDDVRAALRDDAAFRSGHGVAANPVANALSRDTTLASDDEDHARRRRVLMRELGARALAAVEEPLRREADALVAGLRGRGHFDGTADFAARLPTAVVARLVGVRDREDRMLRWAAATFDGLGPVNRRSLRVMPRALGLVRYTRTLGPGSVARGSWAASVFDAHGRGELSLAEARALVIDFVAPSLDTTILAATHLLRVLAADDDTWAAVRADPSLAGPVVMETVRLASPVRGFTRRLSRAHVVSGTTLPAGARVVLLFAAANRDERRFRAPDAVDLHRPNPAHLGWGNGPHACVGMHLAKLELRILVEALAAGADRVVTGTPTPLRNNTLQGTAHLPARLL